MYVANTQEIFTTAVLSLVDVHANSKIWSSFYKKYKQNLIDKRRQKLKEMIGKMSLYRHFSYCCIKPDQNRNHNLFLVTSQAIRDNEICEFNYLIQVFYIAFHKQSYIQFEQVALRNTQKFRYLSPNFASNIKQIRAN